MTNYNLYNSIAVKARANVRHKFKDVYNINRRNNLHTLKGYCADISQQVYQLLEQRGIKSYPIAVHSPRLGGGNHMVILTEDDYIIDASITQYLPTYKYVYTKMYYNNNIARLK